MTERMSRRRALASFGAVSLGGLLAACGDDRTPAADVTTTTGSTATVETKAPPAGRFTAADFDGAATCEVATELTEGPYYFDVDSIRSDIREDREGLLLRLGVRVRDAGTCEPIENAIVDIWHCDATGLYSGFESASQGGPGGGGRSDERTYLRGAQATNSEGIAEFRTIYPGKYPGRTTHLHAKVHLDRTTLLTTQLFTSTAFDQQVHARPPYEVDPAGDTTNDADGFYTPAGELTLAMAGDAATGLITLDVRRA